jgi:hypothetical protein
MRTPIDRAPVHRAAQPPGLTLARGLAATPARPFTPGLKLKAGALGRTPVANDARSRIRWTYRLGLLAAGGDSGARTARCAADVSRGR